MLDRLRRWFWPVNPSAQFTLLCVHCDHTNVVDATELRVQTVDGSPDIYLTVRCENCRRVTPTKVSYSIADKALAAGARLVQFREIPPISEKTIARFMATIDDEYDALCEALG